MKREVGCCTTSHAKIVTMLQLDFEDAQAKIVELFNLALHEEDEDPLPRDM